MAETLEAYRSGSTEPWTVDIIAAVIRAKKPSVVIETGTFEARGTATLLAAMNSYADERLSRLYTVEIDPDRASAAREFLSPYIGRVDTQVIIGDALGFLRSLPGQLEADIVFLDDTHVASHVREEIEAALAVLRPGGVVFVHDVVGVFGLGNEIRRAGGVVLDLPRLHISGGLGVVTK